MNKDEILDSLQNVFRNVFDDDSILITLETTSEDIDKWDSLENINLIMAIENHFHIKFSMAEMKLTQKVGSLVNLIYEKKK